MLESYFFKGVAMGLVFGVPAGAVGVLTIRNSLERGFTAGLLTGIGSSAADLFYAFVTVFGVSMISDFLLRWQRGLGLAGGGVIILLGILNLAGKESRSDSPGTRGRGVGHFGPSFMIAIMNPATILSFFVAFTAFGISGDLSRREGLSLILGILAGTLFWWTGLSGAVALFRKHVTLKITGFLNLILGGLLILLGTFVVINGLDAGLIHAYKA